MSLTKKYLSSSFVGLIGKGFNMVSMLAILWLLNAMLDKEGFGLFMVTFALMFTIAMIIASGFQALLIYHVSRLHGSGEETKIKSIAGQIFWLTFVLSSAAAGIIWALSVPLEYLMDLPGLAHWIELMALFIPAHATAIVLPSLPRAMHKAEQTILYQEILLNGLRVLFLGICYYYSIGGDMIAISYITSAALPVLFIFMKYPVWPSFSNTPLKLWDFQYVGKISLFQTLNQPFRGLDVLLVGAFASAGAAADYTMATRLAQLLWIPKHAASQLQVPRMGTLLKNGDKHQLMLEYNTMRSITLSLVLIGCAFLLFFGQSILLLFGPYENAFPVLLLLAAAAIVRTGVGTSGDLMSQTGHAGWSAVMASLSMFVTIGGCALLVPEYGANGAAFSVLFGTIILFGGFWNVLLQKETLNTMPLKFLVMNIGAVSVMGVVFFIQSGQILAGLTCIIMAILTLALDRSWLAFIKDKANL